MSAEKVEKPSSSSLETLPPAKTGGRVPQATGNPAAAADVKGPPSHWPTTKYLPTSKNDDFDEY